MLIVLGLLLVGFGLLFQQENMSGRMNALISRTKWGIDEAARRRALEGRRKLQLLTDGDTLWTRLERWLYYTGIKLRFPGVTAEMWLAVHLAALAGITVLGSILGGMRVAIALVMTVGIAEALVMNRLRTRNLKLVNEHMMKLLDFLGNYSITSGEVTSIFFQVSRYMENPIKTVLEACYYEAQTTGDAGLALLGMAEKIEHPKFKELACNMEISLRYCADFTALVTGSRRSLREYLKSARERNGMLREALISMLLLLGMSVAILCAVSYLVQVPVFGLLFRTVPGGIGVAVLVVIGLMFVSQLSKVHY